MTESHIPEMLLLDPRAEELLHSAAASGDGDGELTSQEVADWLGVAVVTVQAWRKRAAGYPPWSRKFGRVVIYRRADIIKWLEERRDQFAARMKKLAAADQHRETRKIAAKKRTGKVKPVDARTKLLAAQRAERRAQRLARTVNQEIGGPNDLLNDQELTDWFDVGEQWAAQARIYGTGPPFVVIEPGHIRYRRWQVIAWLNQQETHVSTSELPSRWAANRKPEPAPAADKDVVELRPRLTRPTR